MDYVVYLLVRFFFFLLRVLPYNLCLRFLTTIARLVLVALPRYRKIAQVNLRIAFPQESAKTHMQILRESCQAIARLVMDFSRLYEIDRDWVDSNVDFSEFALCGLYPADQKPGPVIYATGHLGSFELLAHVAALIGLPLTFVARSFKNKHIDRWWNEQRMRSGNKLLSREGAFKGSLRTLTEGRDLAILFDQNVTLNHAVFVDFFSLPAATTKTPAILALRTNAPLFVVSIRHLADRKYKVKLSQCEVGAIYGDDSLTHDEKIQRITQIISNGYQEMIRNDPGAWFWMHRRWKTRPPGSADKIY